MMQRDLVGTAASLSSAGQLPDIPYTLLRVYWYLIAVIDTNGTTLYRQLGSTVLLPKGCLPGIIMP